MELYGNNVTKFVCGPGDVLRLCQPLFYPPIDMEITDDESMHYKRNGFIIMDHNLGKFIGDASNMCVLYQHMKPGRQVIQYISSALGENIFYIILDGIALHDHSSLQEGGPAYATYYSRIPEDQAEEL